MFPFIWILDYSTSVATTIIIGLPNTTITGMAATNMGIAIIMPDTAPTTGMTNIMALDISVATMAHEGIGETTVLANPTVDIETTGDD